MIPAAPRKPNVWTQFTEEMLRKIVRRRHPAVRQSVIDAATREILVEMLAKEEAS